MMSRKKTYGKGGGKYKKVTAKRKRKKRGNGY